jgi:hypothetical protein
MRVLEFIVTMANIVFMPKDLRDNSTSDPDCRHLRSTCRNQKVMDLPQKYNQVWIENVCIDRRNCAK